MNGDRLALALLLTAVVSFTVIRRDVVLPHLRRFLAEPAHPVNLAVFRIAIFGTILLRTVNVDPIGAARNLVDAPDALQFPPDVAGWVVPTLPVTDALVTLSGVALVAGSIAALVGLVTRPAAAVAALSAVYLLGVPQWFGKVNHDHQHLVWFALLCAIAPAGDALSVDAWRRRRRGEAPPGPAVAYGMPLRLVWLMLGAIYLSAGLGKIVQVGFDWPLGDNMRNFLWLHWVGYEPPLRIDRWEWLVVGAGFATIAFELGFVVAILFRRTRWLAAATGFAFHTAVRFLMGIGHFWTLQAAYVSFVDWHALARRMGVARDRSAGGAATPHPVRTPAVVAVAGGALTLAVLVPSLLLYEQAWPVSAYPSFGYRQAAADSRLELAVVRDGDEERLGDLSAALGVGGARYRFLTLRALGEADEERRAERLAALWQQARDAGAATGDVDEVRIYRVTFSLDPDHDGRVLGRDLVSSFDPRA